MPNNVDEKNITSYFQDKENSERKRSQRQENDHFICLPMVINGFWEKC